MRRPLAHEPYGRFVLPVGTRPLHNAISPEMHKPVCMIVEVIEVYKNLHSHNLNMEYSQISWLAYKHDACAKVNT